MEIIDMIAKRKLKKMVSVLFILGCFFIGNTKCGLMSRKSTN